MLGDKALLDGGEGVTRINKMFSPGVLGGVMLIRLCYSKIFYSFKTFLNKWRRICSLTFEVAYVTKTMQIFLCKRQAVNAYYSFKNARIAVLSIVSSFSNKCL